MCSLTMTRHKCNVKVTNVNGTSLGFILPAWNGFGQYGGLQPTQAGALEISFPYSPDSPSQIDFTATNGPTASFPFFGAGMYPFAFT
jgi:hypothetical protein